MTLTWAAFLAGCFAFIVCCGCMLYTLRLRPPRWVLLLQAVLTLVNLPGILWHGHRLGLF